MMSDVKFPSVYCDMFYYYLAYGRTKYSQARREIERE